MKKTNLIRKGLILLALVTSLPSNCFSKETVESKETPTLRIAFGNSTPPNYWVLNDGSYQVLGLMVDLLKEVANLAGFKFEAMGFPLARVQLVVKNGQFDGMINVVTPERLEFAVPSAEPLVVGPVSIFARKDNPEVDKLKKVKTFDDLANTKVAVVALNGSGWTQKNIVSRGMKVYWSDGTVGSVRMLIAKRGDIVVDMSGIINWILKDEPGGQDIIEMPNPIELAGWHLMISKDSPFAKKMKELNSAIATLKASPKYSTILKKYNSEYPAKAGTKK